MGGRSAASSWRVTGVSDPTEDTDRYLGWNLQSLHSDRDLGTESNPKVWVTRS